MSRSLLVVYRVLSVGVLAVGVLAAGFASSAAGLGAGSTAIRGRLLLETTHEACSKNNLSVVDKSGNRVAIPYGTSRNVPVENGEITWHCGGSKEKTGCPAGTNLVEIVRSQGRPFTVNCYQQSETPEVVLERIGETCSEKVLTVVGRDAGVHVGYARSSANIPVSNGEVIWYCGATRERTKCPEGTSTVRIERSKGRHFTVVCMQR